MKVTKYYCDHCEKEVDDDSELHLVQMVVHHNLSTVIANNVKVCYECVYEDLKLGEAQIESEIVRKKKWRLDDNFFKVIKRLFGKGEEDEFSNQTNKNHI